MERSSGIFVAGEGRTQVAGHGEEGNDHHRSSKLSRVKHYPTARRDRDAEYPNVPERLKRQEVGEQ